MRAPAQVVRGLRSTDTPPESIQNPVAERRQDMTFGSRPAKDGERVYHTTHAGLIVQITSPADRFDPSTGGTIRARPVKAVFEAIGAGTLGEYRTSDPEIQKELESNPRFGLDRSYWRADEFARRARTNMKDQIKSQLKADPDLVSEVLSELGSGEFDIPAKQAVAE